VNHSQEIRNTIVKNLLEPELIRQERTFQINNGEGARIPIAKSKEKERKRKRKRGSTRKWWTKQRSSTSYLKAVKKERRI